MQWAPVLKGATKSETRILMTSRTTQPHNGVSSITLQWPQKRLTVEPSRPLEQQLESYPPESAGSSKRGLLLYGDNFDGLSWLLANGYAGTVRLVYLDPPYNSNRTYTSRIRLRGKGQPSLGETTAYDDVLQPADYLQFLTDRLLLLRELLHADGTLWLHCDHRMQAHLLLLLKEIFGADSHLNTVFWRSQTMRGAKVHARYFPNSAQAIHIFRRTRRGRPFWHAPRREIIFTEEAAAAQYMRDERGFFRTSDPGTYSFGRLKSLFADGRLYAPFGGDVIVDEGAQRVYASNGGNIGVKYYLEERARNRYVVTKPVDNLWDDIAGLGTVPGEDENYPTQKTERLLQRILETASRPGELVLDPFAGSGTTLNVAHKLDRDWIGCDSSWRAVRTAACRLSRRATRPASAQDDGDGAPLPDCDAAGDESRVASGYRVFRIGDGDFVKRRHLRRKAHINPTAEIRLDQDEGRLTVRIGEFYSPEVARLAAKEKVALPGDWRVQVRAVLIDPDYDGATLRPALVDAPAGKSALVAGVYTCAQPVQSERQASKHTRVRNVATVIVDVTGDEHLFVEPVPQCQSP